jgi:hypothetical protein
MLVKIDEFGAKGSEAWVEFMTSKHVAGQPEGVPSKSLIT